MGDACCYQCFYQRQLYASKVLRQHHNHQATLYKVRILSEKTTVDSIYFFLEVRSFLFIIKPPHFFFHGVRTSFNNVWVIVGGGERYLLRQRSRCGGNALLVHLCSYSVNVSYIWPPIGLCNNALRYKLSQLCWICVAGKRRVVALLDFFAQNVQAHLIPVKRWLQCSHFVQQATQGPDVRFEIVTIFMYPLWWHVVWRANLIVIFHDPQHITKRSIPIFNNVGETVPTTINNQRERERSTEEQRQWEGGGGGRGGGEEEEEEGGGSGGVEMRDDREDDRRIHLANRDGHCYAPVIQRRW